MTYTNDDPKFIHKKEIAKTTRKKTEWKHKSKRNRMKNLKKLIEWKKKKEIKCKNQKKI